MTDPATAAWIVFALALAFTLVAVALGWEQETRLFRTTAL
jgi:hypothetical protein